MQERAQFRIGVVRGNETGKVEGVGMEFVAPCKFAVFSAAEAEGLARLLKKHARDARDAMKAGK